MPRTPQRNAAVPAAVRPGRPGTKRTLLGYRLVLDPAFQVSHGPTESIQIDPYAQVVAMAPMTFSWVKSNNAVLGVLVHEKAEAVRTMQVRMVDVSSYSTRPTVPPNRPKPVVQPTGIKALCGEIQHLVADMAAPDVTDPAAIQDMARRYGKLRDAMADLRAAFSEAEGQFDLAQALLIQKMGDD